MTELIGVRLDLGVEADRASIDVLGVVHHGAHSRIADQTRTVTQTRTIGVR